MKVNFTFLAIEDDQEANGGARSICIKQFRQTSVRMEKSYPEWKLIIETYT